MGWEPVNTLILAVTAGILAWTAMLMRSATKHADTSASQSNAAATTLAVIESQRLRAEMTPQFRVTVEPWSPGMDDTLRMRVRLLGPLDLEHLDALTISIRDDHHRRGEHQQIMGGPTKEEVQAHIWGPYRFNRSAVPDDQARGDGTGRTVVCPVELPVDEELVYELERTQRGHWMNGTTQEDWQRQRGTVIRLVLIAEHKDYRPWRLPVEIDTASMPAAVYVPQDFGRTV